MADDSVEKLSEVLTNLQDLHQEETVSKRAMSHQVDLLKHVQEQMQLQLQAHDAQIAALQELIALLSGKAEDR